MDMLDRDKDEKVSKDEFPGLSVEDKEDFT
jgi:hypothetical protein